MGVATRPAAAYQPPPKSAVTVSNSKSRFMPAVPISIKTSYILCGPQAADLQELAANCAVTARRLIVCLADSHGILFSASREDIAWRCGIQHRKAVVYAQQYAERAASTLIDGHFSRFSGLSTEAAGTGCCACCTAHAETPR